MRSHPKASHPRRRALAERLSPLCHRVDEGDALLQIRPGSGVFALKVGRVCQRFRTAIGCQAEYSLNEVVLRRLQAEFDLGAGD